MSLLWALLFGLFLLGACNDSTHKYEDGEEVMLWANKVGPFNNPLETYEYFSLPLCRPKASEVNEKFPSLGEALQGDELSEHEDIKIHFKKNVDKEQICAQKITAEEAQTLHDAILQQYWYQFYLDDLPMWATLGKTNEKHDGTRTPYIYLHQHFSLGYNGDRVVVTNLTVENEVPIPLDGGVLYLTYSVKWSESPVPYEQRFRRYLDNQFFEHKIHWFSIFNSFMMVVFLAGLVFTILSRTLKADYQRYARDADDDYDEEKEFTEDSGWKQVHADVFRVPPCPSLFCALVGTGLQLTCLVFAVVLVSIWTVVYTSRGALLTYGIIVWAITSYVAGYFSGSMFATYSAISPVLASSWIKTMVYTAVLFPGTTMLTVFLMNFVAWGYRSSQAIPFGTMIVMLLIWGFVSFPLVIFGTMVGRHARKDSADMPRVSQIPRLIPEKQWYLRRWVFVLCGGILPFGSIFIELYFVFTSFWNYKFYYVYGFMLLVLVILMIVVMCVSIVSIYFQLSAEDHRWPCSNAPPQCEHRPLQHGASDTSKGTVTYEAK